MALHNMNPRDQASQYMSEAERDRRWNMFRASMDVLNDPDKFVQPKSPFELAVEKTTTEVNRVEKLVTRYRDYNDDFADACTYILGVKTELERTDDMSKLKKLEERFTAFTRRVYDALNGVSSK